MGRAYIKGTGSYVPKQVVKNSEFEGMVLYAYQKDGAREKQHETGLDKKIICSDAWIVETTGARERHIAAEGEYIEHLALNAAIPALEDAGIEANGLSGIIVGTISSHYRYPSTACLLQEMLGAKNATFATEVAAACAGYIYSLNVASALIRPGEHYLVVGAEILSRQVRADDKNRPLFGDGAGAAVLGYTEEEKGILCFAGGSDPHGKSMLINDEAGDIYMNGRKVYVTAGPAMASAAREVMQTLGWKPSEIYLIAHQANINILNNVGTELGLSKEQVFVNIDRYANMSSGTCAVGLDEARKSGLIKPGSKTILVAFGSGFVWRAAGVLW